jgi:hypothetical protein
MSLNYNFRKRFRVIFWTWLLFFSLCYFITLFTDLPSNLIYHGEEVKGFTKFLAHLILIPLSSAFVASISITLDWIAERVLTIFRKKPENERRA